jgi:hypothetical protein
MNQSLTFNRGRLADFLACQRRYQLRYERRLAWPVGPLDARAAAALKRGRRFHRLLQRHFLGLPPAELHDDEPELARWWRLFQAKGPPLPAGRRLPEFNLTVPIGQHFLTGRYDLLIVGEDGLTIYDWKTGVRPPGAAVLRADLQTRVYLALAAEGASALRRDLGMEAILSERVQPDEIRLTFWYASDPPATRSLVYGAAWHQENWAGMTALVSQIADQLESGDDLPLTDALVQCRRCAYQAYCGRQVGGMDLADWQVSDAASPLLEPDRP